VGYDIYQNGAKVTSVSASSSPQVTLTGLTPSTAYSFTATARSAAGSVSTPSASLSVTTGNCGCTITAPQAQATQVNFTDVVLSWTTPPQSQLAYYNVFLNNTKVLTVDAGVTSADVIGLTSSTAYIFSVQAVDTYGDRSALSNTVSATTAPYPAGGAIGNVSVQQTASAVTISAVFLVPWSFRHVYIDADNNAATGYLFGWETPNLGADYLIENDTLLYHTGSADAFSWSTVATVEPTVTGSPSSGFKYTWTIPTSEFTQGVPLGKTASYLVQADGYAPEVYAPIVTATQQ
jgi:chitodextrinase